MIKYEIKYKYKYKIIILFINCLYTFVLTKSKVKSFGSNLPYLTLSWMYTMWFYSVYNMMIFESGEVKSQKLY